jgi:hypothetical protein
MSISVHPYLSGHPYRLHALVEALEHITAHDSLWFATGSEIADWYYAHHYDAVLTRLIERRARRS